MAILRAYHFMHPICTKGIHERQHQRNFVKVNEITTLDVSESRSQMRIFYKNLQRLIILTRFNQGKNSPPTADPPPSI